jgi:hypothetical protein
LLGSACLSGIVRGRFFGHLPHQAQVHDVALIGAEILAKGETKLTRARGIVVLGRVVPKPTRGRVREKREIDRRKLAPRLDDLAQFVQLRDAPVIKAGESAFLGNLKRFLPGDILEATFAAALAAQPFGASLPDQTVFLVADGSIVRRLPAFFIEVVLGSTPAAGFLLLLGGCDGRQQQESAQYDGSQHRRRP